MGGQESGAPPAKKADGSRLSTLEEKTLDADKRLGRLEVQSQRMREDVDLLAEATGGLRQQSAKMREAALRVAEVVTAVRKRKDAGKGKGGKAQPVTRPPRT